MALSLVRIDVVLDFFFTLDSSVTYDLQNPMLFKSHLTSSWTHQKKITKVDLSKLRKVEYFSFWGT